MAKMTLLEMVQTILSEMSSDEVNSINDNQESLQIAYLIKDTYHHIIDGRDWPWLYSLFTFNSLGDVTKPTHIQIPSTVVKVNWIKYDKRLVTDTRKKYGEVKYLTPEQFLSHTETRDSSATNVQTVTDFSGTPLLIYNDRAPTYFTSFDENYIIFDSFDSDIDTTITVSKTQAYGKSVPSFTISDSFYPDIPEQMYSYLLNESKATAFQVFKQMPNQHAEQRAITQRRRMSQEAWKVTNGITIPNYGRK